MSAVHDHTREYVTLSIGSQTFGVSVTDIQDVFAVHAITPVPLSRPEIAGVLNLRGRIVTAIDARSRLGLPPREDHVRAAMAVGVESNGEAFGLIIDSVGEVLKLAANTFEPNPINLDPRWATVSRGVHRLQERLLVILDIDRMLDLGQTAQAA
jgi:purine-binding chemotaxis protein CheW